ncbi:hypothetical protein Xen7305DRAFT_00013730 [Xenococcus sp. PCC 7305]|uniref:hypothetical protein n=1 Tax=Xenococcus sp. PCC 7305 TaxID=102125 RepID=UPI0002AD1752|nr:hypothetical protein [Xenococcus sp. PCC 7305]ELS01668.1 hypothetical protein Xen7305DRAFT_00013730 [Xenococcus sp. PCC 7305]
MKKLNILLISLASIGFIGSLLPNLVNPEKAVAQSDCYMVGVNGEYTDLSSICDAPRPVRSSRSRRASEGGNISNANVIDNLPPIQIINNNSPRRYVTLTRKNTTIIRHRGTIRHNFLDSISGRYNNTGNRILTISDPYFSGSEPIIYRYRR